MRPLADTRTVPLATTAALYEAHAARREYDALFFRSGSTPQENGLALSLRDYRDTAESAVVHYGYPLWAAVEGLSFALASAQRRVTASLPKLPRIALESLKEIHAALAGPDQDVTDRAPLQLIWAFENVCQTYGLLSPRTRTTCPLHPRLASRWDRS
jgi:hypothetical protein